MPQSMSKTQRERFIRICQDQGIRVTPTKKGLLVRFPDGSSTVQHFTNSDVRAEQNQIARFRRAGMTHPNDTKVNDTLPAYITSGTISPKTRQKIVDYIISEGFPEAVLSSTIVKDLKMDPGWANRALYHSGFRPGPAKSRKVGRPWYTPEEILCLKPEEREATPEEAAAIEEVINDPIEEYVEVERPIEDREQTESAPLPEPVVDDEPQVEDLQFIDVRDSWVPDLRDLLGGELYVQVKNRLGVLNAVGMEWELRVWRK